MDYASEVGFPSAALPGEDDGHILLADLVQLQIDFPNLRAGSPETGLAVNGVVKAPNFAVPIELVE